MGHENNRFALIGVAGYIAIRHVRAIKETNNELVAALDLFDSVGFLDSYFPATDFFTEYERFDRHIDKLKREDKKVDYISICTPNYLHDAHIRFALKQGAHAICEKPLVLNPWNIDGLQEIEQETGKKINNILQLRLHPALKELKRKIDEGPEDKIYDVDLAYLTSRGSWYHYSWKGNDDKSGGIATNIGIHFYDMLTWIFGDVKESIVHEYSEKRAAGFLHLEKARVRWILSVDENDLPDYVLRKGQRTYRSITVNDEEVEFSKGFTDLHTLSYIEILKGNGFGTEDSRRSIEIVHEIRNSTPIGLKGDFHPLCK